MSIVKLKLFQEIFRRSAVGEKSLLYAWQQDFAAFCRIDNRNGLSRSG